ncbi:MAG: hypothetical protein F7B59_08010 [Desulfurococcales archaeon]|nr:hypothetical protein [Desulfurococcales archaeon]
METRMVGVITIIAIIAIAGALALGHGGSNNTITSQTESTPTQSTSGGSISIEGTWHGTYKGVKGNGEWKWVIKKTNANSYAGCLQTTGTYSSSEGWMPVTVSLSGDEIEIGSVGPNAVVFSGKISGNKASGSWHFSTNYDSGTWEGVKESLNSELACTGHHVQTSQTSTTPYSTTNEETTATTTQPSTTGTTTTITQTGIPMCKTPPPTNLKELNDGVMEVLASVFGSTNIFCNAAAVQGNAYSEVFTVSNIDPAKANSYVTQIVNGLNEKGWINITTANGQIYALSSDQSIQLIILTQVQSTIGNIAIQIGPS